MATIYGIQLKAVRRWTGRDGHAIQAKVYMDGQHIREFMDAGNGGESELDIYPAWDGKYLICPKANQAECDELRQEFNRRRVAYFNKYGGYGLHGDKHTEAYPLSIWERESLGTVPFDADAHNQRFATAEDAFMRELGQLMEREKAFRKNIKKGYKYTVGLLIQADYGGMVLPSSCTIGYNDESAVEPSIRQSLESNETVVERTVYKSLDDFNVTE